MKPLTWWQRNMVQGRAEVVLFWVLALLVAAFFLLLATGSWATGQCVTQTIFLPDGTVRFCTVCPGMTFCS